MSFTDLRKDVVHAGINWLLRSNAPIWVYSIYGESAVMPLVHIHFRSDPEQRKQIGRIAEQVLIPKLVKNLELQGPEDQMHTLRFLGQLNWLSQGGSGFLTPNESRNQGVLSIFSISNRVAMKFFEDRIKNMDSDELGGMIAIFFQGLGSKELSEFPSGRGPLKSKKANEFFDLLKKHATTLLPVITDLTNNKDPVVQLFALETFVRFRDVFPVKKLMPGLVQKLEVIVSDKYSKDRDILLNVAQSAAFLLFVTGFPQAWRFFSCCDVNPASTRYSPKEVKKIITDFLDFLKQNNQSQETIQMVKEKSSGLYREAVNRANSGKSMVVLGDGILSKGTPKPPRNQSFRQETRRVFAVA